MLSVLIPVYNRADLISDTLDSIIAQDYPDWECIVVDDGSTDQTAQVVCDYSAKDSRIKYFLRPETLPKGPNACRNYAYAKSNGAWVKFFDSDDIFTPDAFTKIAGAFAKDPDVVVSALAYRDFHGHRLEREYAYKSDALIDDYLVGKVAWYTIFPTWKKTFLERQPELFDVSISNLDDWDFNLRMLYASPSVAYIDEELIFYRMHDTSLSCEIRKLNLAEIESEFMAREKHLSLLRSNKMGDARLLENFVIRRHKFLLRQALLQKSPIASALFFKSLSVQARYGDWTGLGKILLGYLAFSVFGKGYKLLS